MEPFNKDVENLTKKPNVSLSSLIILMSVEMKSSKALCHSGYFPDWISEGGFMKIFSYIAGVDVTRSTKVWAVAILGASSRPQQLTSPWEFFSGVRWERRWLFVFLLPPSLFSPSLPAIYLPAYIHEWRLADAGGGGCSAELYSTSSIGRQR